MAFSMNACSGIRVAWMPAGVLVAMLVAGCGGVSSRLNAPPQGWAARQTDLQQSFVYMTDNAMLAEMCVSDVHFVPRQGVLNSLGARRLDRYADLLRESGGTLHYDTEVTDTAMVAERIESVQKYLASAGLAADMVKVKVGGRDSAQMTAVEAMAARQQMAIKASCAAAAGKDAGAAAAAGAGAAK